MNSFKNNVKIQNNVSVYEGVELEDYVCCGPSMVFTNVKLPQKCPQPVFIGGFNEGVNNIDESETMFQALENNIEHEKMKTTYSVHSTDYNELIAYCEKSSTLIQQLAV